MDTPLAGLSLPHSSAESEAHSLAFQMKGCPRLRQSSSGSPPPHMAAAAVFHCFQRDNSEMDTSQANDLSRGQRVRWTTASGEICSGDGYGKAYTEVKEKPETLARGTSVYIWGDTRGLFCSDGI